jgi:multicomponent Na+:H+ antiporter subunit D
VLALRQERLKLLIAYSTIAQIGYLFFLFPLAGGLHQGEHASSIAWTGGWLQLFSHAFAKAAMFMAAGLIAEAAGHDRIADLGGIGRVLPITAVAFGLAGLSLMGVPPSGGFVAKSLLLVAAVMDGQWVWAVVMLAGGLLAGGYVLLVLGRLMGSGANASAAHVACASVSRGREMVVLAVALCAVALGFAPLEPSELLQIGRATVVEISAR